MIYVERVKEFNKYTTKKCDKCLGDMKFMSYFGKYVCKTCGNMKEVK